MKLKEAMKKAKETGKTQRVTEPESMEEAKVQISIRIDIGTLNEIKKRAEETGIPYTTLINSALKQNIGAPSIYERLKKIEKILKIG